MLETELIEAVRKRCGQVRGIKTAFDYIGGLAPCVASGACRQWAANLADGKGWEVAVKNAASTLVYDDDDTLVGGGVYRPTPDEVRSFGNGLVGEKKLDAPSAGAVMDFEAVITTARKDRDGDILEPGGAEVDTRSPLLYMHIPFELIGKLVALTVQNSKRIAGHLSIIDSLLGRDVAQMVEFGCLRISQGFRPLEFEPLEKEDKNDWRTGFHVKKYEMVEVSLVSIPSNKDAVVTLFSRGKMAHPLNKAWGQRLREEMPDAVRGGFEKTPETPAAKACGCDHKSADADADAPPAKRPKISKRNLDKLGEAKELIGKVIDAEIPKAEKTLLIAARASVDDVITDGSNAADDAAGDKSVAETIGVTAMRLADAVRGGAEIDPRTVSYLKEALEGAERSSFDRAVAELVGSF
jgi:hypothetical protein